MDWKLGYGTIGMIALMLTAGTVFYAIQSAPPEIPMEIRRSQPQVLAPDPDLAGLRISINTASVHELELLPDIGPVRAEEIHSYIRKNGRLSSAEDLLEIPGIGEQTLERILPYLVFD